MIVLDTDRPVLSKAKLQARTDRATPTRFVRRGQQRASDSQKHFRCLQPEIACRQRNTQFFKDGGKTAWWVKHIDLPKLSLPRSPSEARSLADDPVQAPTKYELASISTRLELSAQLFYPH